jgi:frataxin-like iron-binding protein CyaY
MAETQTLTSEYVTNLLSTIEEQLNQHKVDLTVMEKVNNLTADAQGKILTDLNTRPQQPDLS